LAEEWRARETNRGGGHNWWRQHCKERVLQQPEIEDYCQSPDIQVKKKRTIPMYIE